MDKKKTCKDCIHFKVCYLTHIDGNVVLCEFQNAAEVAPADGRKGGPVKLGETIETIKQVRRENAALRAANEDQADKLLQAQARVRELEREISVLRAR